MHSEVLLMCLALGIYFLDAVVLLERDEAIFVRTLAGNWRVKFGLISWKIRGKEPILLNPLTPYAAAFKLTWDLAGQKKPLGKVTPLHVPDALGGMALYASGAALGLWVLLPLGLFTSLGPILSVGAIAFAYANVAAILVLMASRRVALGLSARQCVAIAFECIACIPLGVNLLRRLARQQVVREDLITAANRLLHKDHLEVCLAACSMRIAEEIDAQTEGSAHMGQLQKNLEKMRNGRIQ